MNYSSSASYWTLNFDKVGSRSTSISQTCPLYFSNMSDPVCISVVLAYRCIRGVCWKFLELRLNGWNHQSSQGFPGRWLHHQHAGLASWPDLCTTIFSNLLSAINFRFFRHPMLENIQGYLVRIKIKINK